VPSTDAASAPRRTRAYQVGALVVTCLVIAAVLVAVLSGSSTSQLRPGRPMPGAGAVLHMLAGIPQRGYTLGSPHAPVQLTEFGDLQCPACAAFSTEALPAIIARYVRPGRVAITFRPLAFIGADSARATAMAGALAPQGRAWQFIELMYRNQGLENSGYVTPTYLAALASAIPGVRLARALRQRHTPAARAALTQATALARALHIQSTPTFLIARSGEAPQRFSPDSLTEAGAFSGPIQRVLAGGRA